MGAWPWALLGTSRSMSVMRTKSVSPKAASLPGEHVGGRIGVEANLRGAAVHRFQGSEKLFASDRLTATNASSSGPRGVD
jgi:hypothetical protein